MKTFVSLWVSSGLFGLCIAIGYWFSSKEPAGTFLLGFMTIGFAWAALYSGIAERNTNLAGDAKDAQHRDRAGEDLGIVTKSSPWPLLLAVSVLVLLLGAIWSDFLLFAGLAAAIICAWRLGAESARTGSKYIVTEEGKENVT